MENEPVFNPYAAPQADLTQPVPLNVEATRRHLLKHEASVKSIGILYTLGGIGLVLSGVSLFAVAAPEPLIAVVLLALGILQLWLAVGLRKLKKIVRIPTMILAGIGLIGFPIGTLISAYILYLLGSQKGLLGRICGGHCRHTAHQVSLAQIDHRALRPDRCRDCDRCCSGAL